MRRSVSVAALGCSAVFTWATSSAQDLRGSPPLPPLPVVLPTSDYSIRVVEVADSRTTSSM